jgi:hypothetical protein
MYLLYCDESNLEEKDNDFFVYGGMVVDGQAAQSLSLAVDSIRQSAKVPLDFIFKFNPGPEHLSHKDFIALKQAVIEAAIAHGCVFLTSMILHNVATSPAEARRNEINRICYHYDCYLNRPKSHGLVLIDRFEDKQIDGHLREKFSIASSVSIMQPLVNLTSVASLTLYWALSALQLMHLRVMTKRSLILRSAY